MDPGARVAGFFYWPFAIGLAAAEGDVWAEPGSAAWFAGHQPSGLFWDEITGDLDTQAGPGEKPLAFSFKIKKNGDLAQIPRGWMGDHAFRMYLEHVRGLLSDRARRIAGGEIGVEPRRQKQKIPCDLCDYAPVCRIETLGRKAFRSLERKDFKQFCEAFGETEGGNA